MFGFPLSTATFLWILPALVLIGMVIYSVWDDKETNKENKS